MRSLLIGVALLMTGSGLLAPLLGLEATAAGFGTVVTGLMLASYYGGFLIGSVVVPGQIASVGHIRVFAALGSLASGAALLHALVAEPLTWILARLVTGACMAGLFVVVESWLNGLTGPADRGRAMARYMFVLFAGLGLGQVLLTLDIGAFRLIVIASVAVSLAVVPVSLTRAVPPWDDATESVGLRHLIGFVPLAVAASTVSGLMAGAVFGFTAVYGTQVGLSVPQTSLLLTVLVISAAVLQPPLGALSDRLERRRVIAVSALVAGVVAGLAAMLGDAPAFGPLVACTAVAGGLGVGLYALGVAHAGDYLPEHHLVGAGAKLVLVNGAGAMCGPLLSAVLTDWFGPPAFFWLMALTASPLGAYALYRTVRRARAAAQVAFVPAATTLLTPVAATEMAEMAEAADS